MNHRQNSTGATDSSQRYSCFLNLRSFSPLGTQRGTAASSQCNSKVLPGNWLEKEIRFGVEQRRKEARRDERYKNKGHSETQETKA